MAYSKSIKILKEQYGEKYDLRPVSKKKIEAIEKALEIKFPEGLLQILSFYDGFEPLMYTGAVFDFPGSGGDISTINLDLRKRININKDWLALEDPDPDGSFSVMNLKTGKVYLIAAIEYEKLFNGEPLEYDYDVFDNFLDFFAFLLEEDDKE